MTVGPGQVVVITGGSRGIGAATGRALVRQGARVGLIARDGTALKELAEELGGNATWAVGDITDDASITAAMDQIASHFGRIDAVVANAGHGRPGTVNTVSTAEFAETVNLNLVGTYRSVKAALPHLRASRGYLLIVSSLASSVGLPALGAYSSSKAGTEMLAHTLQMELAHEGIGVGSMHPWFTETDLIRESNAAAPSFARMRSRLAPLRHIPGPLGLAGTTITAEECADIITTMVWRRLRKRHAPRSAGSLAFSRIFLNSSAGELLQRVLFGRLIRRIERELMPTA